MANRPRAGRLSRAERIEETRRLRDQGLTHREVAERLDISVSTVANDLRSTSDSRSAGATPRPGGPQHQSENGAASTPLGPLRAVAHAARQRLPYFAPDPMSLVDRTWPVLRRLMKGHTAVYRVTGGRIGHRFPGSPPMLLLDHLGAKSGRERTTPLVYVEDGRNLVLVASKGGNPKNPAWFHNLRANPETTVQVGSEIRPVRARVAPDEERKALWPKFVAFYPGYDFFQRHAGARKIPIVILDRR